MFKVPVHVEVSVRPNCSLRDTAIVGVVNEWISRTCSIFKNGPLALDIEISNITDSILVTDLPTGKRVSFWQAEVCLHVYRLSTQGPENDFMEGEEELPAAEQWELPNALLNNLWNSIVIDDVIKTRLLSYCSSSIRFSEARIDTDIISWNRMILLHGPPGTGKTTICKGLAQKTYIRNSDRFSSGILLEVNSHSLFSKWFSESGKLVMKLFAHIAEIAEDEECMVVVLIDEVESITASRGSAARSNEPGDAVRVVNAVLTSLDALKRRPNVLVLCTSNLVDSVDPAFLDRVDLKVHLGAPPVQARYNILHSCLAELASKHIITPSPAGSAHCEETLLDDCGAVEKQILTMALARHQQSGHQTATAPTSQALLQAFVQSVSAPDLDDSSGYYDESDAAPEIPECKPPPGSDGAMELTQNSTQESEQEQCGQQWSQQGSQQDTQQSMDETSSQTSSAGADADAESCCDSMTKVSISGGYTSVRGGVHSAGGAVVPSTAAQQQLTVSQYLYVVATLCQGMSGRSLRKLPIKAHSYYLQRPQVYLMEFISAMHATIASEKAAAHKEVSSI